MCKNEPFKFIPGMYKMNNGQDAEVFAERDGKLYGRFKTIGTQNWVVSSWNLAGGNYCYSSLNLVPPKPPVVVDDELVEIFYKLKGWEKALQASFVEESYRKALAAVISRYLEKNQ